jgi:hypothetical protein
VSSISIAVIHNQDPQRLAHILPASRALADRVGATLFEVYEQPAVKTPSFFFELYRQAVYWKLNRDLERSRGIAPIPTVRSILSIAIRTPGRMSKRVRRSTAILIILTSKHVRAWESFIAGGDDYLVVLEDDALFQADTADRFCAMLDTLAGRDLSRLLYVDLAGGVSSKALGVSALINGKGDGFIHFTRPVTNTTCGYLISRATAQHFYRIMASRPRFRCLGTDWVINGLMIRALAEGSQFDCRHSSPPMFQHGSLTGLYGTLIH